MTEGDVITIFSQWVDRCSDGGAGLSTSCLRYGEVMDVNLPRDKETGKTKGFGFLMYEDQRSTILAVDNLNGAKVLDRTLRVDHVKNYKQPKVQNEEGEWVDPEEQSLNAKPQLIIDGMPSVRVFCPLVLTQWYADDREQSDSSESSGPDIDPEDPMRDYLIAKWKEERAARKPKKKKSKGKHKDETPEERAARKARRKERRAKKHKSEGVKAVEDLLSSLTRRESDRRRSRSRTPQDRSTRRSRSRTPVRDARGPSPNGRSPDRYHSRGHKRRHYDDDEREDDLDRYSRSRHSRDN